MKRRSIAAILTPLILAACGGGSVEQKNTDPAPASVPPYQFKTPRVGTHLEYAASLVDNLGNSLNRTVSEDVTTVNADGSFVQHVEDPSHDTFVSGATDQTLYPTDYQYNAAGQPTSWIVAGRTGSVQCTASGAAGAPARLASGSDWNTSFTEVCGNGPGATFTQSGTLAGIEGVTVPAGTFQAYKFVSTTSYTQNGLTRSETTTRWRDSAGSDTRVVKEATVYTYTGGTPPAGSPLQLVRQLQSFR